MTEFFPTITKSGSKQTPEYCFERRKLILGGVALLTGATANPWLAIAKATHPDALRKINLSGRQRMLIQRAGKLICLAHLTPQPQPLLAAAEETLALHQRTEVGLRKGDQELGLEPETNAIVLQALSQAARVFAPYGKVIRNAINSRVVGPELLGKISGLNDLALREMDAAVNLIETVYRVKERSEQLAMLINIAGRQRMFTQRMVLQLCLYHNTQDSVNYSEFFRTMNRFSISLNILQRVTPTAVSNKMQEALILNLSRVQNNWDTLRPVMSRAVRSYFGSTPDRSFEALIDVDRQAEDLITKMNEIVLLFEKAYK